MNKLNLKTTIPYLYIFPGVAVLFIFIYWPMIYSLLLSFYRWDFVSPRKAFRGFANYGEVLSRDFFWISMWNTGKYIVGLIPFEIFLPLGLALLLSGIVHQKVQSAFKIIIFLPSVLSFAVACFAWLWMFNPLAGFINRFLGMFHIPPVSWLTEKKWALYAIIFVSGWRQFGYSLILFMAGLSTIPDSYIEAAELDGAGKWRVFWRIKWPLLSPVTFFLLITTVIFASSHAFIPIHILTRGGPSNATTNLTYLIYQYAFELFNIGSGSVVSVVTFVVFLVITYAELKYVGKYVHYGL